MEDAEYLGDIRNSLILSETRIMDVMVAMKDSCKLLSGLFGNFHNDSDSTFHADTYIDQSSHSDDEHDSDWEGLWILRKKGKRWKMLYICKGFVIATIWSWTIP